VPALVAVAAVVLAIALYLVVCFLAVTYLVGFGLAWVVAAGTVAGVLTVVVALVATLADARWAALRTIGPDDVNNPAWFPPTRTAFRRDRAWPNYLVAQAREDLATTARNTRDIQAKVWAPAHRFVRDELPYPLAWWPVLILLYGGLLAYSAGVLVAGAGLFGLAAIVLVERLEILRLLALLDDRGRIPQPNQDQVHEQPARSTVAVEKGMDPQEAVVDRANRLYFSEFAERGRLVGTVEPRHETRQVGMLRRQMTTNFNSMPAPIAWNDRQLLAGPLVGYPEHLRR